MSRIPKTFSKDYVLRDEKNLPIARVVLSHAADFVPGQSIKIAMMTVSSDRVRKVKGRIFYVDGDPYRVPPDLPGLKITNSGTKIIVNNFYLEPVR